MLRLARELDAPGRSVLVTTTTHILDPRREPGGPAGRLVFRADMELPYPGVERFRADAGITLLISRETEEPGKVKGLHPSWFPALKSAWDVVLVEADGSRRLPLKAPGDHEPVLPPGTDLVVGVVGLDGLGRPMDGRSVHRPELFARVTGCAPGSPVVWEHVAALVRHPEGLFRGSTAARVLLLNKADAAPFLPSREQLAGLGVERVLVCRLEGEGAVAVFGEEAGTPCR
jgi:probable selenium-dependent hydroxylase accessory protein YqeC